LKVGSGFSSTGRKEKKAEEGGPRKEKGYQGVRRSKGGITIKPPTALKQGGQDKVISPGGGEEGRGEMRHLGRKGLRVDGDNEKLWYFYPGGRKKKGRGRSNSQGPI